MNPTTEADADREMDGRGPGMSVKTRLLVLGSALVVIGGAFAVIMSQADEKTGPPKGTTGIAKREAKDGVQDVTQFTDYMSRQVTAMEKARTQEADLLAKQSALLETLSQRLAALEMSQGLSGGADDDGGRRQLILDASPLVRSLVPESSQYLNELARDRGFFAEDEAKPLLSTWISARRGGESLSQIDLDRLYQIARVRREALTDQHLHALSRLQRQAEADKISLRETIPVAKWVWTHRSNRDLVPTVTPGQILGLAHHLTQISTGVPLSGRVAAPTSQPAEAAQPLRTSRFLNLPTRRVRDIDVPRLLLVAAALRPTSSRPEAARVGVLVGRMSDIMPSLEEMPVITLDRALERGDIAGATPASYLDQLTIVPGSPTGEIPFAAGALAGLASSSQRPGVLPATWIGECVGRIAWPPAGDRPHPVRTLIALANAAGVTTPDLRGVPVDQLETIQPAAADEVLRTGVVPPALAGSFQSQAALAAPAAAADSGADIDGAIRQGVYRAAVATLAVSSSGIQVRDLATSRYAILFSASARNWSQTGTAAALTAERAIAEAMAEGGRPIAVTGIAETAGQLQRVGLVAGEQQLAMAAVGDHVGAEIGRYEGRTAPGLLREVRAWADRQIQSQVVPPFEVDRLALLGTNLARDAGDMLAGRKRIPKAAAKPAGGLLGGTLPPLGVNRTDTGSREQPASVQYRHLTIPSGSYGTARIFAGVVCPLGQNTPEEMLINLDYYWVGPNRTRLRMRDLRIIGMATAMPGPARVKIKLDKMSYVFPSRREWNATVRGWAVDNLQGMSGVPGNWELNVSEVLPVVAAQGLMAFIQGVATPKEQVIVNNSYTTTLASDTSSSARLGAAEAAKTLTNTTSDFAGRILSQVGPSVAVPNNQPLTCILYDAVDIMIPADEWSQVVEVVADNTQAVGFSHAE